MTRPVFHGLIIAIVVASALYATFLPSRSTTNAGFLGGSESAQSSLSQLGALTYKQQTNPLSSNITSPLTHTEDSGQLSSNSITAITSAVATTTNNAGGSTSSSSNSSQSPTATPTPEDDTQISATGAAGTPTSSEATNAEGTPISSATPTPMPEACESSGSSLYCVYTVVEGDTLSGIATKFNLKGNDDVMASEMIAASNKPDVQDEDELSVGQKLRIPLQSGVIHTVLSAQTLSEISNVYDVSVEDIVAVEANGLGDADSLAIGQELLVPNPIKVEPFSLATLPIPDSPLLDDEEDDSSSGSSGSGGIVRGGPSSGAGFIWPASGPISSNFGPSHPLGIDIDFFSAPNQPVGAVASGTVTFAGGNTCCSYGLYVIVDHGNGLQTLYAHLSSISVSVGERVSQGQQLGLGGRTGYATGNHLHFEVHVGGAIVNPMSYLP